MSYSQVSISNIALAMIGETAIRDFDENNTRARMCQTRFGLTRDSLLAKFDWPFARGFSKVSELILPVDEQMASYRAYAIPGDCRTVRGLEPRSGRYSWEILGDKIMTPAIITGVFYTRQILLVNRYSDGFVSLLALALAIRLAPALSKDRALTNSLAAQFKELQNDTWEAEANVGNTYRHKDSDPNLDTFSAVGLIAPYASLSPN